MKNETKVKLKTKIRRIAQIKNGNVWLLLEGWGEAILIDSDDFQKKSDLALAQVGDSIDIEFNTKTFFGCVELLKFRNLSW